MKTQSMLAAAGLVSLAVSALAADELATLLRAHQYAQAERIASDRLQHDPTDAIALAAKAEAIGKDRPDEAIGLAQQCVQAHPQHSRCYLALGNALGAKARNARPLAAMHLAGEIRDAFLHAVWLDPHNTDARFALLDYYLQAPALVGGGKARARTLAAQTEAINPAAARLMQAQLDLANGTLDKAEAELLSVPASDDEMVADRERELLTDLSRRYEQDKRHADSERVLKIAHKRFPGPEHARLGSP
jgi:tetratricopeptide (TPR) repeat protein